MRSAPPEIWSVSPFVLLRLLMAAWIVVKSPLPSSSITKVASKVRSSNTSAAIPKKARSRIRERRRDGRLRREVRNNDCAMLAKTDLKFDNRFRDTADFIGITICKGKGMNLPDVRYLSGFPNA